MTEEQMRLAGMTGTRYGYYLAALKQQRRQERRAKRLKPIRNLITLIRKTLHL